MQLDRRAQGGGRLAGRRSAHPPVVLASPLMGPAAAGTVTPLMGPGEPSTLRPSTRHPLLRK
jgi:hypothetical protein